MKESSETITWPPKKYNCNVQRKKPIEQRFWEKVDKNGPVPEHCPELGKCWVWAASTRGNYGAMSLHARKKGGKWRTSAHRYSWIIHNGEVAEGLFVLHKCDNKLCVNPNHLFLGTNADNIKDLYKKGRGSLNGAKAMRAHYLKNPSFHAGENCNLNTKLTESQAKEIKSLKDSGQRAITIANKFGINYTLVSRIWSGQRWKHI